MRKLDPVKHEEKRQQILQAASRCFMRDGFRGASTSNICAEAKISPGHLYHYFSSKEAIVSAMVESRLAQAAEHLGTMTRGTDVVTSFLEVIESGIGAREPSANALMLDLLAESARNPAIGGILRESHRGMRTLLANLLRKGQECGQIDVNLDPDVATSVLVSFVDGAKAMMIRDPDLDPAKSIEMLKIAISRFLRAPDAANPDLSGDDGRSAAAKSVPACRPSLRSVKS
ncbi:TetR/AcrR family transcriptional regulator [Bradyrhizobium sp. CCGUVB14]|uniref:TetR/AcrR family transcriptional regulator n=1 Tax=Bradyrhizobium sp. CCGUVB14 TaxID=2949628 RepID=UPI0020B22CB8|nr:TetR/AcrR family transcriptional regulator [Bradyrhizobium sp. CCGUVB14]MCP3446069.1 TetR/AcrR family transcriptional regulator [Bradyrhizobium sp. CCGUVB14]